MKCPECQPPWYKEISEDTEHEECSPICNVCFWCLTCFVPFLLVDSLSTICRVGCDYSKKESCGQVWNRRGCLPWCGWWIGCCNFSFKTMGCFFANYHDEDQCCRYELGICAPRWFAVLYCCGGPCFILRPEI